MYDTISSFSDELNVQVLYVMVPPLFNNATAVSTNFFWYSGIFHKSSTPSVVIESLGRRPSALHGGSSNILSNDSG